VFLGLPVEREAMEGYETRVREERRKKDEFFGSHPRSPLPDRERERFDGLSYYPIDEAYRFELELGAVDGGTITVETTHDGEQAYRREGRFRFAVDGVDCELTAFSAVADDDGGLWVPFRDATSGETTYGAGRYLDVERPNGGAAVVDFNRAYHPSCAYSDRYECPLVPPENRLDVRIEAGERLPG